MMPFAAPGFGKGVTTGGASGLGLPVTRGRWTSNFVSSTNPADVTLDAEDIDDMAALSVPSADILVPATALYRATFCWVLQTSSSNTIANQGILSGASAIQGTGRSSSSSGSTNAMAGSAGSTPLALTAGADVTLTGLTTNGSTLFAVAGSSIQVEKLKTGLLYCAVRKSANQTIGVAGTLVDITWDTFVAGDNSYRNGDNIHLVVPSGMTRCRVAAGFRAGAGGLSFRARRLALLKNDTLGIVGVPKTTKLANQNHIGYPNVMSPPINVVAGDTFKAQALTNTATNGTVETNPSTFFSIEEVPSEIKSALASCTTSTTTNPSRSVSGFTYIDINFDTEDYDDAGIWSLGSPAEFIVPAGCYRARFHFFIDIATGVSAYLGLRAMVNLSGAGYALVNGSAQAISDSDFTGGGTGGYTQWIAVNPGDKFKLQLTTGNISFTGTNIALAWACLECQPNP